MSQTPITLQAELFEKPSQAIRIDQQYNMQDADILFLPTFLDASTASAMQQSIYGALHWEQRAITVYQKTHRTPRLVAWCADTGVHYEYSKDTAPRQAWPAPLLTLKQAVENYCQCRFNGALLNYYRTGEDSMGWHADDEASLGSQPLIASISLGGERDFQFKPKASAKHLPSEQRVNLRLNHGSLLIMRGHTQTFWQHALPKRKRMHTPRMNITFRYIYD